MSGYNIPQPATRSPIGVAEDNFNQLNIETASKTLMADLESTQQPATSVPDLYRLLELLPLESDRGKIEAALKRVLKIARDSKTTDARMARRAARLVELGRQNLLDSDRKATYDQRWEAEYGAKGSAVLVEDWNWEILNGKLPRESPTEPFNLSMFLTHAATLPESDPSSDFEKLIGILGRQPTVDRRGDVSVSKIPRHAEPGNPKPAIAAQLNLNSAIGNVQPNDATMGNVSGTVETKPALSVSRSRGKSTSLAGKIRKKRERSLLFVATGALGSLGMVLGVLYVVLQFAGTNTQEVANQEPPRLQDQPPIAAASTSPRGSGLPKVQGLDVSATEMPPMNPPEGLPSDAPAAVELANTVDPGMPMNSGESMGAVQTDPAVGSPSVSEPTLTVAEKDAWREAMTAIRRTLREQDYPKAVADMEAAQELAKTRQQKDQFIRLMTVANLARELHAAIVSAVQGLSAAETFKAGSTPVSFVEGDTEQVILKINGRNQTFQFRELPLGIAFGLADLKLDISHPSTAAKKAAYALLHTDNDLGLSRAKKLMSEAVAGNELPGDTIAIFDDDYQL